MYIDTITSSKCRGDHRQTMRAVWKVTATAWRKLQRPPRRKTTWRRHARLCGESARRAPRHPLQHTRQVMSGTWQRPPREEDDLTAACALVRESARHPLPWQCADHRCAAPALHVGAGGNTQGCAGSRQALAAQLGNVLPVSRGHCVHFGHFGAGGSALSPRPGEACKWAHGRGGGAARVARRAPDPTGSAGEEGGPAATAQSLALALGSLALR